jgi:hypothetical protein
VVDRLCFVHHGSEPVGLTVAAVHRGHESQPLAVDLESDPELKREAVPADRKADVRDAAADQSVNRYVGKVAGDDNAREAAEHLPGEKDSIIEHHHLHVMLPFIRGLRASCVGTYSGNC